MFTVLKSFLFQNIFKVFLFPKLKIFLFAGVAIIGITLFFYIKLLNNKIDYLKLQTETYKAALEESNRTIEELQRFNSLQKREIENLNKRNAEIENQRNQLARQLRNLNLNNNTDPKEIENKINSFINDLFKRLENNSKNK